MCVISKHDQYIMAVFSDLDNGCFDECLYNFDFFNSECAFVFLICVLDGYIPC